MQQFLVSAYTKKTKHLGACIIQAYRPFTTLEVLSLIEKDFKKVDTVIVGHINHTPSKLKIYKIISNTARLLED